MGSCCLGHVFRIQYFKVPPQVWINSAALFLFRTSWQTLLFQRKCKYSPCCLRALWSWSYDLPIVMVCTESWLFADDFQTCAEVMAYKKPNTNSSAVHLQTNQRFMCYNREGGKSVFQGGTLLDAEIRCRGIICVSYAHWGCWLLCSRSLSVALLSCRSCCLDF